MPETLTATVRTALPSAEDSVQDSGSPETATPITAAEPEWEETTVDIPVKWESTPAYDMDAEGEYVFTPVIGGYDVRAELPEITVTVGELPPIAARGLFTPMSATTYDIWVGEVQVTSANASDVLGDGTVSYTPAGGGAAQTLSLKGAKIGAESQYRWDSTTVVSAKAYAAVYAKESLNVVLTGNNSLTGGSQGADKDESYGLYCGGALTITGGGALEAIGATMNKTSCVSYGLFVKGTLSIGDGTTVTARGGDISGGNGVSFGVFGKDGGLTVENATLTVASGTGYNSFGVRIMQGDISITNSDVTVTSGTTSQYSRALEADAGNISISGGTVSASAENGASPAYCIAIYVPAGKNITISSSAVVTARAGSAGYGGRAMSQAPNLDSYGSEYYITASRAYNGGSPETYNASSIIDYRYLDMRQRTATPTTGTTSASKSSASQNSISFTLTNSSAYTSALIWKVYSGSTGQILANGVTATKSGNTLTLSHAVNIPAATYYVAVTESGKAESGRLALTVGAFVPASLTGTATISNTAPRIGDTLTASLVGGNNTGTLNYVWKAGGAQVGTGASYTVTAANFGAPITLEITSSVETGTVSSAPTTAVAKKAAPAALVAPTLLLKTNSYVMLTANSNYDFSKDGINWQAANTFTGLSANTPYTFYQRFSEKWDTEPSAASVGFEVTTDAATYTITANPASKNFDSLAVGYSAPAAQTVTITNTGNTSVTLTQPTSTNYTIGALSATTLATNGTATFTVAPKAGLAVGNYNETLTVNTDHSTNATVELSFSVTAVPTYIVTFNPNGGTVSETSRSVALGTAVGTLPTPTRSGSYSFDGWYTAASGGTQISSGTTVSANVTYYAHWTYTGGGGSGSGGGSSSNDNSSPVIVTPPAPDKPNSPTQGEIKVSGTVDSKGNITVNITGKTVIDAFEKALADAKKNGNEQNGITVILRVDTGSKTGSNVTVNLPKTVQDTIIEKKIVNTIVVVDNPDIRIGMDLATVQEINKQAKSDVNITATRGDSSKLTGDAKKAIGSRPVFDLKVNYGNDKAVSSFGAGSVSVTIPYTLGANEKAGNVQAVYVDAKGKVHWLTNSVYDSVEKVLRFSTNHFSTYGIGYKQTNTAFTDIAGHWAKEDIEFVVSRGLFSGTSNTTFSPSTAMTRGMFVTALGRLANADVSGYAKSSFTDVKGDAYYMGYIEWASKNNIVNGTGNNKFAPDQSITREQMAVIMSNYAKTIGYTLPKVHVENIFTDNAKISAYAKDAVKQMQMAGVISGKNSNLFDPQGTATRAEVSAVLRRFVELAISSDTMQGWTMNDSGKWMYYENGKPITGKKEIDSTTYTFDQYGVTADVPKNLKYTSYTVQKGDSFWRIAHKLGCTMNELERLNNRSRFDIIFPGDVLRVPKK